MRDTLFFIVFLGGLALLILTGFLLPREHELASGIWLGVFFFHVFASPHLFNFFWPRPLPGPVEPFRFQLAPGAEETAPAVEVEDPAGKFLAHREEDLMERLRTVRQGEYGSFLLTHSQAPQYALSLHFFQDVASLYYFPEPDSDHPGLQAVGGDLPDLPEEVTFSDPPGGDDITMAQPYLLPLQAAYVAAAEFFKHPDLPPSLSWEEL